MSLILDALKQADSERSAHAAPGVFGQVVLDADAPAQPPTSQRPLVWLLAVPLLALALWFAWPLATPGARPPAAQPAGRVAPMAPTGAAPLFKPVPAVAQAPAPREPAPATTSPKQPAAARTEAAVSPAPPAREPEASPTPAQAPPPVQAPNAAELPAGTRAQLPSVQIGGHTYSGNPALRMLMIDGRMVVEGQAVSTGLRLEHIGPHQAVFNHRGTRFSVDY